jgi:hypothetical protein
METKTRPLRNILFFGLIIGLMVFYFRKKIFDKPQSPPETVVSTEQDVAPLLADATPAEHITFWNACIECQGRHSGRIYASYDRYVSWADPKKGQQAGERNIYGLYETYDPRDCEEKLAAYLREKTYPEGMDEPTAHFLFELKRVYGLTSRMNRYYELEDYKDDQLAFGRQMHDTLLSSFKAFHQADSVLWAAGNDFFVNRLRSEQLGAEAGTPKAAMLDLLETAYQIEVLTRVPSRKFVSLDSAKVKVALLESRFEALEAVVKSQPYEEASRLDYPINRGLELVKSAKNIVREYGNKFDPPGRSWGYYSDDQLLSNYSSAYNSFRSALSNMQEGIPLAPESQRFFWRDPKTKDVNVNRW